MPIRLLRRAESDLDDIYRYSLSRWGADRADRYIDDVTGMFTLIEQKRAVERTAGTSRRDLLRTTSGSHVIYFLRGDRDVHIVRILHERMDPIRHLP